MRYEGPLGGLLYFQGFSGVGGRDLMLVGGGSGAAAAGVGFVGEFGMADGSGEARWEVCKVGDNFIS